MECLDYEISILFVSDEEIRILNKEYLGNDKPTNVISFPMRNDDGFNINSNILGDIVISIDRARIETKESSMNLENIIIFYLIHGILHLLGYSHGSDMDNKKEEIFSQFFGNNLGINGRRRK